ncbi:MAG: class B sortase, partial [Lachnospiraceae bacterium]|nr:class B sortase [Lachnospiraceae bacterium]
KAEEEKALKEAVKRELKARRRNRRILSIALSLVAAVCLGYFGWYVYTAKDREAADSQIAELKGSKVLSAGGGYRIHRTTDEDLPVPDVLEEYQTLYNANQRLIGWIKIDDTNIDYPVMQTVDNEYYLTHNITQENDKNGAIFLDKDCDIIRGNTNWIVYGHHMHSGRMFGTLDKYASEEFYLAHPTFQFDTIYEKGTWQVLYAFRSRVYEQTEIVFKYYQFIDVNSEEEFDSAMYDMAQMSLYDTGNMAAYGDRLLTLSTCDNHEQYGRFVVVAKKVG